MGKDNKMRYHIPRSLGMALVGGGLLSMVTADSDFAYNLSTGVEIAGVTVVISSYLGEIRDAIRSINSKTNKLEKSTESSS